jgi:phospholipase B1
MAPTAGGATIVHQLRPADISVVGALGDSITAGFGARATSLIDLVIEARGASWIIGGDDDVATVPNFLRVYNADLTGFSLGNGNANRGFGDASISGAVAPGMFNQATTLVNNMRTSLSEEDFEGAWKLVSVWIGGNDICSRGTSAEEYVSEIERALDHIQANLPRTFVNLVTMVDVGSLYDITGTDIGCTIVRPAVCSRGANRERSAEEASAYQAGLRLLMEDPKVSCALARVY